MTDIEFRHRGDDGEIKAGLKRLREATMDYKVGPYQTESNWKDTFSGWVQGWTTPGMDVERQHIKVDFGPWGPHWEKYDKASPLIKAKQSSTKIESIAKAAANKVFTREIMRQLKSGEIK